MKMVVVAYNIALDEEVMESLQRAGAENYTKWPHVLGKGSTGGTHLDNEVWPGHNSITMVLVDEHIARRVMDEVRKLRAEMGHEGIKAFMLNVEDVT